MKEAFGNFANRRREKALYIPKVITKKDLESLQGNYLFDNWGVCYLDLSEYDFSKLDLSDMDKIAFSTSTKWPSKDKLPKGFEPNKVLEECTCVEENAALVHELGIEGKDINVAVIDSGFQGEKHLEFNESNLIRCTLNDSNIEYHFHMEDVLSKLCGKNLGIAPACNVFYYEIKFLDDDSKYVNDALLDILKRINEGNKIRAVSCSFSLTNYDHPFEFEKENIELVEQLKGKGCEVIDSTRFGKDFFCCGTSFYNTSKYKVCSFAKDMLQNKSVKDNINIVCSGRTIPEFCSEKGYKYEVVDCFSWSIPQCVGYYCLCLQIDSNITFDGFVKLSKKCCDVSDNGIKIINIYKMVNVLINNKGKMVTNRN